MKHHLFYFFVTFFILSSFISTLPISAETTSPIPGRIEDKAIRVVKIGNTDIYFYMTPEKHAAALNLVKELNSKKLLLVADVYEEPYFTTEISALASIYPDPIEGHYADLQGNVVLDQYTDQLIDIFKKYLKVDVEGISRELNVIVSQDAHKFHQDQFQKQYDYLNIHHDSLPKCKIIHDLTLIDWNMSEGTISGTLFQDEGGDRLLMPLLPNEVVGMITTETPIYPENNVPPIFPGPTTLPFHAVLSPIDKQGSVNSGSAKGQRISSVVRGVIREENLQDLESQAIPIFVNRPILSKDENGLATSQYNNGIVLKQFPSQTSATVNIAWNQKMPDYENVEILKTQPETHSDTIHKLIDMFKIQCHDLNNVQVRHLIKKDNGFSQISLMNLDIPTDSTLVLINNSKLPEGYKFYNISEDLTDKQLPWIQMYNFKPEMAMKVDFETFKRLSLTPLEELIFRNEITDAQIIEGNQLQIKPVTRIDIFAFPNS